MLQETDTNDDASVVSRTMITVNSSIQRAGGTWVHQPAEEINPSDDVMTRMLGILEPMREKEQIHEIGVTTEEMTERLAIYEHHQVVEAEMVVATVPTFT